MHARVGPKNRIKEIFCRIAGRIGTLLRASPDRTKEILPSAGKRASASTVLTDITDPRGIRVTRNEYDENGRLTATIDADGHRVEFTHDVDGKVERVKDRRGNTRTLVMDDSGRVLSETNALNQTTTHSYDPNGYELTRTDPLGHATSWEYDSRGNITKTTNALLQQATATYNSRNKLVTKTDAVGRVVMENGYDDRTGNVISAKNALGDTVRMGYDTGIGSNQTGELVTVTDPLNQVVQSVVVNTKGWHASETDVEGRTTTFTRDANGRVLTSTSSRTDANGQPVTLVTGHTFDDKGRETRTAHADGNVSTTEYNAIDKATKTCDVFNHCTTMEYDARGNLWRTTFADGTSETKTYDEEGNTVATTDRGGRTTKFVFDAANRLIETILPDATSADDADNPRLRREYDAAGRLSATIDQRGNRTSYGYDDANRLTTVTDALSRTAITHYDQTGRKTDTVDPQGHVTRYTFDDLGRLTQTQFDDSSTVRTEYDKLDRKTADVDQRGRRSELQYSASGELLSVKQLAVGVPAGSTPLTTTSYSYDELGNKLTQTDAEGRITRWTYDNAGHQTSRTLPSGQTETFEYDLAGNRTRHIDFNGQVTTFEHDAVDRLTRVVLPGSEGVRTYTYTPTGQRATVTDSSGTATYTYDENDRLIRVVDANGRTIEYGYDLAGNRTSMVTPSQSMAYTFDTLNRLDSATATINGGAPLTTRYEYDVLGNRSAMLRANGTRTDYGYNVLNRLTHLEHKAPGGALLFGVDYFVDAAGMRTGADESDALSLARSTRYEHDDLGRLTSETVVARDATNNRATTWTYDRVGNRLSQSSSIGGAPAVSTTYSVDANDRLQSETTGGSVTTYSYDANGNTLSKSGGGSAVTYRYSSENRLIEMSSGGDRTAYAYDSDGLRIASTRIPVSGPSVTTRYVLDKNRPYAQVVEELTQSGSDPAQLAAVYTFADELVSQSRCSASSNATDCLGAVTSYRHADGMNSSRLLTDAAGALTDSVAFDAFGNQIARSGSTVLEHLYRGEQFDADLGLYNLRARYMNPATGRFVSADSFAGNESDPISLHKYLYANASPINVADPSGNFGIDGEMMAIDMLGSMASASHFLPRLVPGSVEDFRHDSFVYTAFHFHRNARMKSSMISATEVGNNVDVRINMKWKGGAYNPEARAAVMSFAPSASRFWTRSNLTHSGYRGSGRKYSVSTQIDVAASREDNDAISVGQAVNGQLVRGDGTEEGDRVHCPDNWTSGTELGHADPPKLAVFLCAGAERVPQVSAHEFGHLLGFGEAYYRFLDESNNDMPTTETGYGDVMGVAAGEANTVNWYHIATLFWGYH